MMSYNPRKQNYGGEGWKSNFKKIHKPQGHNIRLSSLNG